MKFFTTEDIKQSIDDNFYTESVEKLFDESSGPCRHVSVRPNQDKITLFLDNKEIMSQSLKVFGYKEVPMKIFNEILSLWRDDKMKELKKYLKVGE